MGAFRTVLVAAGAAAALSVGPSAEAKAKYLADVNAKYPAAKAACATCHVGAKPTKTDRALNPFGLDVKRSAVVRDEAGKKSLDLSKVEAMDSDGDGKTNAEELAAGTNPGDPASR